MKFISRSAKRALCLSAVLCIAGCGKTPVRPPDSVRPVYAVRIEDSTTERVRSFSGTVRPTVERLPM